MTQHLRNEWGLNAVLGDGGEKQREDHRHHAVDAVVVALTEPGTVKMLSDAAVRAHQERRGRFARLDAPWPGFLDEVRRVVGDMVVSHRAARKVRGAMHEESVYSKPQKDGAGRRCHHIRKRLSGPTGLSKTDVKHIVDPGVRECVRAKLAELESDDPKRAFSDRSEHPHLTSRDGRKVPIHSVRVRRYGSTTRIGEGVRGRWVVLGSNHHIEILETKDAKGRPRWEGKVVSTCEAMRRVGEGEPIVQREHGRGKKFVFSLSGGEIIEIGEEDGTRGLYVIRSVSVERGGYPRLEFVGTRDARKKESIKRARGWKSSLVEPLRKKGCGKVVITPLGEVRRAND